MLLHMWQQVLSVSKTNLPGTFPGIFCNQFYNPFQLGVSLVSTMDFIVELPASRCHTVILSASCLLVLQNSCWFPFKNLPTAQELASVFAREVFYLHRLPKEAVSDCGIQFVSRFWHAFCSQLTIQLSFSTRSPMVPLNVSSRLWSKIFVVTFLTIRTSGLTCNPGWSLQGILLSALYPECLLSWPILAFNPLCCLSHSLHSTFQLGPLFLLDADSDFLRNAKNSRWTRDVYLSFVPGRGESVIVNL